MIVRPITIQFDDRNGDNSQEIQAQPGDIVYLLIPRAEGEFLAWFKGRFMLVDAPRLLQDNQPGYVPENDESGYPKIIWWVQIKNSQGQIGWTDQSDHFDIQQQC